jgi:hypothetical protein
MVLAAAQPPGEAGLVLINRRYHALPCATMPLYCQQLDDNAIMFMSCHVIAPWHRSKASLLPDISHPGQGARVEQHASTQEP